jgi:uncharacterized protein (TIGR02444 family)
LQLSLENPLWNFTLAVYPEPGVSDECIALQDRYALDVDVLLFCAYAGGIGVTLTADDIAHASAAVAGWHCEIVRPLRAVRRALKPIEADAAQALRASVKKDELTAEQIELAMLWAWSRQGLAGHPAGDRAAAIEANIAALLARHGGTGGAPNLVRAALRQPT